MPLPAAMAGPEARRLREPGWPIRPRRIPLGIAQRGLFPASKHEHCVLRPTESEVESPTQVLFPVFLLPRIVYNTLMEELKPGQVINPGAPNTDQPSLPQAGAPEPVRPPVETSSPPPPAASSAPITASVSTEPTVGWQFNGGDATSALAQDQNIQQNFSAGAQADPLPPEGLRWTASEFVAHEKSPAWYGLLALGGVASGILIYFITKDKITTGIILFAALALGIFAGRKPRVQEYGVSHAGLRVGQKNYAFYDFKSFSVAEEGAIITIVFLPLKRFMPALTIYVAPDVEDKVVDFLADILPIEKHRQDMVDSFMKRIRF